MLAGKSKVMILDVHCDIRVWDWDVHFLWKYPSYSWNIQTVWQCSIQLESPSSPYTWINYQLGLLSYDWQTKKGKKCLLPNWQRSVSDNRSILEWIFLKDLIPPLPLPLLLGNCQAFGLRGNMRMRLHFYLCGLKKTNRQGRCGEVAQKISRLHAKKKGRHVHPYVHLYWL